MEGRRISKYESNKTQDPRRLGDFCAWYIVSPAYQVEIRFPRGLLEERYMNKTSGIRRAV